MILTICLPMIDRKYLTTNEELQKLGLESDGYKEIDNDSIDLMDAIEDKEIHNQCAGGACYNTIKSITEKSEIKTYFIGAIGNDEDGILLSKEFDKDKINSSLEQIEDICTASCNVLLNGKDRSMVTNIGAADFLSKQFIIDNELYLKQAKIIYLCGYAAKYMPVIVLHVITKIVSQKLIFNLSNELVLKSLNKDLLTIIIKKSNVIIGNMKEMEALVDILYHEKYDKVHDMMKAESDKGKAFICTNAEKEVCYSMWGEVFELEVGKIDYGRLDTCGAGDYFAGGFISAYYKGAGIIQACVKRGCEWACEHINQMSASLN